MKDVLTLGVDIGGTRTKYGLVNLLTGEVFHSLLRPTETQDAETFLNQVGGVIEEFKAVANQVAGEIGSIGFGVPGFTRDGIVETTYGFITFMEQYPLRTIVKQQFGLEAFIDNDARTVALGEALYGKGKNQSRVLALTLGTGVGLGLVVNGRFPELLPLAHMGGHMKITGDGEMCYCGKTGCLEALVASAGIVDLARKQGLATLTSVEAIIERAQIGDKAAGAVMEKVIQWLHTGVHNYVNLYAPDIIVLGGGIAKGLSRYLDQIKGSSYLSPFPGYSFNLEVSGLQEHAGMLGSAALCRLGIL